jgi:hypothetical protein
VTVLFKHNTVFSAVVPLSLPKRGNCFGKLFVVQHDPKGVEQRITHNAIVGYAWRFSATPNGVEWLSCATKLLFIQLLSR